MISLISLKITQASHLLLGFAENQAVFWDFKIQNSIQITKVLDNGDSDNRGPIVYHDLLVIAEGGLYENWGRQWSSSPLFLLLCIYPQLQYENLMQCNHTTIVL